MNFKTIDLGAELIECVEIAFLLAPIEAALPIVAQRLQVSRACSVVPAGVGHSGRKARSGEPRLQVVENRFLNLDAKRLDHVGLEARTAGAALPA
jgi:hypothetical protein